LQEKIQYRAGVAAAWVVNDDAYIEYDCGPLQKGKILKSSITAFGVQPPDSVTISPAVKDIHRLLGTKGGLGGLLIAYKKDGASKPTLATITLDFGHDSCLSMLEAFINEGGECYLGTGSRGYLMKKMGISRTKENLLIAAVILGIVGFATIKTFL
jgi:hypothetical protein